LRIGLIRFGYGIFAGIALTIFVALVVDKYFHKLSTRPCTNRFLSHQFSPGGAMNAVVFERNCGENSDNIVNLSIIPAQANLEDNWGNAATVFDRHHLFSRGSQDSPITHLKWINDRKVEIRYDPRTDIDITGRVRVQNGPRSVVTVNVLALPEAPRLSVTTNHFSR
jgi:hypothetical protein